MKRIVFGSAQAQEQLRFDAGIIELEKLAKSRADYNYCIDTDEMPKHLLPIAKKLVQAKEWCHYRETREDCDGDITVIEDVYQPSFDLMTRWIMEVQP